jgi:pimeloyl-ACP methyl ester carboxylesterase
MRTCTFAVGLVALCGCGRHRPSAIGRLDTHACISRYAHEIARCGTIALPERRGRPTGRVVHLDVVVLPAATAGHKDEPIVFLDGGPGLAATDADNYVNWALAPERATHDLVMVDVRGTGGSDRLSCDLYSDAGRLQPYLDPMFPVDRVRECAKQLSARFDLTQYTTEITARDLDDVRAALHAEQWSLFGGSYGTRLALAYMRMFPTRVRRAALLGVLPPEAPIGRDFARGSQQVFDSAFADCVADAKCRAAAPDPRRDIGVLLARLNQTPARVPIWNTKRMSTETLTLTASAAREALFMELYQPGWIRRVLPLVHQAVNGDDKPLVEEFVKMAKSRRSARAFGVTISIYCTEDGPRLAHADSTALASGFLLGIPALQSLLEACPVWPHGEAPPEFGQRVVSSIPTLLMSGGRDPATPPFLADSAALGLSNVELYVDPRTGHAVLDDAARDRMTAFFSPLRN